jgi:ATP-dependent RNA helicase DeaD
VDPLQILGGTIVTAVNFKNFELPSVFQTALDERGFNEPTPVQVEVLSQPDLNVDLVVQARTGSGKTLAFILPLLAQLGDGERKTRLLILAPTRELAMQDAGESEYFGRLKNIDTAALVGGMNMEQQISRLHRGAAVIVGTPGRVLDHIRRGTLDLSGIDTVVLDEGDDMLDMGFHDELEAILDAASGRKKTWLFSATMPDSVFDLSKRYLKDPVRLEVNHEDEQHEDIVHRAYLVPSHRRLEALVNVLLWEHPVRSLVFCHTKTDTGEVAGRLQEEGFMALTLNGDMTQRERSNALESFRTGRVPILVATNVAARGLDIEGVSHVIQLGLPDTLETFVHRSGRTGRAGHEGSNILLLTPQESGRFKFMIHNSEMKVQWLKVPDIQEVSEIQRELREESILKIAPAPEIQAWAVSLLERCENKEKLTAQLLTAVMRDVPSGYALRDILQRELDQRRERAGTRHEEHFRLHREKSSSRQRFFKGEANSTVPAFVLTISKGHNTPDWSVGRILGTLCSLLDVDRSEIGNIKMRSISTDVELSSTAAAKFRDGGKERLAERGLLSGSVRKPMLSGPRRERRFSSAGERIAGSRMERKTDFVFKKHRH